MVGAVGDVASSPGGAPRTRAQPLRQLERITVRQAHKLEADAVGVLEAEHAISCTSNSSLDL